MDERSAGTSTGIEDLRLLVDPGENVIAAVLRSAGTGSATGLVTASGHPVTLP
jgi:hypothetical protein